MRLLTLCFGLFLFLGCNRDNEALRSQLAVIQEQQAKLEALTQKESELRELQVRQEKTLQEIEEKKAELLEREKEQEKRLQEVTQKEQEVRALLARQEAYAEELQRVRSELEPKVDAAFIKREFLLFVKYIEYKYTTTGDWRVALPLQYDVEKMTIDLRLSPDAHRSYPNIYQVTLFLVWDTDFHMVKPVWPKCTETLVQRGSQSRGGLSPLPMNQEAPLSEESLAFFMRVYKSFEEEMVKLRR